MESEGCFSVHDAPTLEMDRGLQGCCKKANSDLSCYLKYFNSHDNY